MGGEQAADAVLKEIAQHHGAKYRRRGLGGATGTEPRTAASN
jgi:hypothetical protein